MDIVREIAKVAKSLLDNGADNVDFIDIENSVREGDKPKIACCSDCGEQSDVLKEQLTILKENSDLNGTVILHRTTKGVEEMKELLEKNGFATELVKSNHPLSYANDSIKLCTMSAVKGLEFNNVFIVDLDENIIPSPQGFLEESEENHISNERKLLYTCMISAKNKLLLFTSDRTNASRYLKEIDPNLLEDITPNNWFIGPYFGYCSFPF